MEQITVRDLRDADVEQLVAIAVAAWEPIYGHYRQQLGDEIFDMCYPNWDEEKSRQIRVACASKSVHVLVATRNDKPVGFVTFVCDGKVGTIGNNAVHPSCQRQGIASRLYQQAFQRMREMGMKAARVNTGLDPSHAPARRAYEKAGFDRQLPSVEYFCSL